MTAAILTIAAVLATGVLYVLAPTMADAWARFRRPREVRCPDGGVPATVVPDPARAAFTSLIGPPNLRLKDCTRWPQRRDCARGCVEQIETAL